MIDDELWRVINGWIVEANRSHPVCRYFPGEVEFIENNFYQLPDQLREGLNDQL